MNKLTSSNPSLKSKPDYRRNESIHNDYSHKFGYQFLTFFSISEQFIIRRTFRLFHRLDWRSDDNNTSLHRLLLLDYFKLIVGMLTFMKLFFFKISLFKLIFLLPFFPQAFLVRRVVHQSFGKVIDLIEDGLGPRIAFVLIQPFERFCSNTFFYRFVHGLDLFTIISGIFCGKLP